MVYGTGTGKGHSLRDLSNQTFGRLFVLRRSGTDRFGRAVWECRCSCGNTIHKPGYYLTAGDTKSCGCLNRDTRADRARSMATHGKTKTPEFAVWQSMIARCYRKSNPSYKNYGGRGITVCQRWLDSFENFLADMGRRAGAAYSLDRFPNNLGNYEPGNCRWATQLEQQNNKRTNRSSVPLDGVRHGTWHGWNAGCGCVDCKEYNRARYLRRKARQC